MEIVESKYTLLPFLDVITAAKLFALFGLCIIAVAIVRAIVFKRALTLHRAKTEIVFGFISVSFINCLFTTFLYWQWAAGLSIVLGIVYAFSVSGKVRDSNSEERTGVWGLNADIRRIRGELFNDMTPEEQIAYRETVKETKFISPLFVVLSLVPPVLAVAVYRILDLGYLFAPVLIS